MLYRVATLLISSVSLNFAARQHAIFFMQCWYSKSVSQVPWYLENRMETVVSVYARYIPKSTCSENM